MVTPYKPPVERFWEKVQIGAPDECWPWQAYRDPDGRGRFMLAPGQPVLAHRYAYLLTFGPFPEADRICHTCDNPPCCNPGHLFRGTQLDNIRDMDRKGRGRRAPRGLANWNARLTPEKILEIRARLTGGASVRSTARLFAVSHTAIERVRDGRTWSHV